MSTTAKDLWETAFCTATTAERHLDVKRVIDGILRRRAVNPPLDVSLDAVRSALAALTDEERAKAAQAPRPPLSALTDAQRATLADYADRLLGEIEADPARAPGQTPGGSGARVVDASTSAGASAAGEKPGALPPRDAELHARLGVPVPTAPELPEVLPVAWMVTQADDIWAVTKSIMPLTCEVSREPLYSAATVRALQAERDGARAALGCIEVLLTLAPHELPVGVPADGTARGVESLRQERNGALRGARAATDATAARHAMAQALEARDAAEQRCSNLVRELAQQRTDLADERDEAERTVAEWREAARSVFGDFDESEIAWFPPSVRHVWKLGRAQATPREQTPETATPDHRVVNRAGGKGSHPQEGLHRF